MYSKLVKEIIAKIRYDTKENILVLKNNKIVYQNVGESNFVELDFRNRTLCNDSILIHNHTKNTSFSENDIYNTISLNAKAIILVTPSFKFTLTRPKSGWNIDFENANINVSLNNCLMKAREELQPFIMNNEINQSEAELEINHYIWLLFFQLYEISYEKTRH